MALNLMVGIIEIRFLPPSGLLFSHSVTYYTSAKMYVITVYTYNYTVKIVTIIICTSHTN